jgi:hypothetical protein
LLAEGDVMLQAMLDYMAKKELSVLIADGSTICAMGIKVDVYGVRETLAELRKYEAGNI